MGQGAYNEPFSVESELERASTLEQIGHLEAAEAVYRELIRSHDSDASAYLKLGVICGKSGRIEEAFLLLSRAIALQPDNAEAHSCLGIVHWMEGRIDAAIAGQKQALTLRQAYAPAHAHLGVALADAGRREEAIRSLREAIRLDPDHPEALANLGSMLLDDGDWPEAGDLLRRALEVGPRHSHLLTNLAQALHAEGRPLEAIDWYIQALAQQPNDPHLLSNLGVAYQETGDSDTAIVHYRQSLVIRSDDATTWFNLGTAWKEREDFDEAIRALTVSLVHDPTLAKTHISLGRVFIETGDLDSGIKAFAAAVQAEPGNPNAHLNLAHALLKAGDYARAWDHFEWRFKTPEALGQLREPQLPRWDGSAGPGIDLLLVGEQGLGDVIQFMRFCRRVGREVGSVSLCVPQPLVELARHSAVAERIYSPVEADTLTHGQWLPLMSALRFLDLGVEQLAGPSTYLHVPAAVTSNWKDKLAGEGQPIVGLHWQGNASTEFAGLQGRSMQLELLSPLGDLSGFRLLSLQKGYGSEQLAACSFLDRFVSCQEEINATWDFVATAAMVQACDLVVTTDSALAHLAGGLGHPTWLLLHHSPDWRWGVDGETTPWYPNMRIFRQQAKGDWAEVIGRVKAELSFRI
jgi:tetratricopeptide (TPR) repeat protein